MKDFGQNDLMSFSFVEAFIVIRAGKKLAAGITILDGEGGRETECRFTKLISRPPVEVNCLD